MKKVRNSLTWFSHCCHSQVQLKLGYCRATPSFKPRTSYWSGAKVDLPVSLPALAKFGWTTLDASLLGTCSCLPQWCRKDSGDSVRLAPGCDVSFKVAPAPLTISEEVYLMGLWRHLTPAEAAHPSPARDWLARCNPNLSPDQAYFQYQEISEASDSQIHGVKTTGTIRLLSEQFVRCKLRDLRSWSSFDSKDYILRGSRMQVGNSSCGTLLLWRGIARGLLPQCKLIQDIPTPEALMQR